MSKGSNMDGFIAKHGLWTDEQTARAAEIVEQIRKEDIRRIRIGWGDQHGIVRGKTLTANEFKRACVDGKDFQLVTAIFDTTNHPIVPPFSESNDLGIDEMIGLPDGILVPDPSTFRVLPWVDATASILSDAFFLDGTPCPLSTRNVLRTQLDKARSEDFDMIVGLECEFTIFKLEDTKLSCEDSGYPPAPPDVSMISHGYQYLTETRADEIDEILCALHENLEALGFRLQQLKTSGDLVKLRLLLHRFPQWKLRTRCLFSGPPSNKSAGEWGIMHRLWRSPRSQISFQAGGTCTNRSFPQETEVRHSLRTKAAAIRCRMSAWPISAGSLNMHRQLHYSRRRRSTDTNANSRIRSRRLGLTGGSRTGASCCAFSVVPETKTRTSKIVSGSRAQTPIFTLHLS